MAKKIEKTKLCANWQDTKTFPERVLWARNRYAEAPTQAAIAAVAGVKQQSIGKAETFGAQGSSNTPQIAAALGVSPHWLATGEGEPFLTLKDIPSGAIDFSIAVFALHPSIRDRYMREILNDAMAFLPPVHPRYKAIEAMFMELNSKKPSKPASKGRDVIELNIEVNPKSGKVKHR